MTGRSAQKRSAIKAKSQEQSILGDRAHTEFNLYLVSIGYKPSSIIFPWGSINPIEPDGFTPDGRPVELKPKGTENYLHSILQLGKYITRMRVDSGELWVWEFDEGKFTFSLARTQPIADGLTGSGATRYARALGVPQPLIGEYLDVLRQRKLAVY